MDKVLKFRLIGENISPESISSNDFSKLISAYEDALIHLFEKQNPNKKNLGFISVVGIKNESAGIVFKPNFEDEIIEVANTINTAINQNTFSKLPYKTVEKLSVIQDYVDKKNCIAELNGYDGIASTRITTATSLRINKSFYIKGETTIYGKIVRIGGTVPKVRMVLPNGIQFSVEIKESDAKKLSPYLYETIGIKGRATWKKDGNELEHINATSFILMENKSLKDRLEGLGKMLGKYWVNIENPDEHVKSLRS